MKKPLWVVGFAVLLLIIAWLILPLIAKQQPTIIEFIPDSLTLTPYKMKVNSSAIDLSGNLLTEYTCDSIGKIPDLIFSDVPNDTKSLALILSDPDAPSGEFIHWILWDIRPDTKEILMGKLPEGSVTGVNSAGKATYYPPCPPLGTHRYVFTLFALNSIPVLPVNAGVSELRKSMSESILMQAEVVGLYSRK